MRYSLYKWFTKLLKKLLPPAYHQDNMKSNKVHSIPKVKGVIRPYFTLVLIIEEWNTFSLLFLLMLIELSPTITQSYLGSILGLGECVFVFLSCMQALLSKMDSFYVAHWPYSQQFLIMSKINA